MRAAPVFALSFGVTAALVWGACQRNSRLDDDGDGGRHAGVSTSGNGFQTDGASICGNEIHQAQSKYPLIYFVIDRSGSMADLDPNSGKTRFERVRDAAADMVESLGSLVRVAAALYPNPDAQDGDDCAAGKQVFAPKVAAGAAFENAIDVAPFGGTPTAATLEAIAPLIAAAGGPKAIILATDGAPNCNSNTTCSAADCMVNIIGQCPTGNCCVPPDGLVENCVDRAASILAVKAIADAGTDVYVVGIPGTEQFASVLNQMASVGGVPQQDADTFYYRVDDFDALGGLFKDIAGSLVSCTFDLSDPPSEPGQTNVYFDEVVVPNDPENGWVWVDTDTIEIVGDSCTKLRHGKVKDIQFVSGCPTIAPL